MKAIEIIHDFNLVGIGFSASEIGRNVESMNNSALIWASAMFLLAAINLYLPRPEK